MTSYWPSVADEVRPDEVYAGAVADLAAKHLGDLPIHLEIPEWQVDPAAEWTRSPDPLERTGRQEWRMFHDGDHRYYRAMWHPSARLWVADDLWSQATSGCYPLEVALRVAIGYADALKAERDAYLAAIDPEFIGGLA